MEFYKKYRHVGYSFSSVPQGWKVIVDLAILKIEKEMWPSYLPMFLKRWIHYLATGNSVVRVKYRWAYWLRSKLTGGDMILDIKEKFAGLRIYVQGNNEIYNIIKDAEERCDKTCQNCSSEKDVKVVNYGWYYNLCINCRTICNELKNKNNEK